MHALIVDDEPDVANVLARVIRACGDYETTVQTVAFDVRQTLETLKPDVMFLDLVMPDMNGFAVLEEAKAALPELTVVIVSTYSTVENAVKAIKAGASDFLPKPFDSDSVSLVLAKIESEMALRSRYLALREQDVFLKAIHGNSPSIKALRTWILKVRGVHANVLIEGESGTGKELVARAIHGGNGPFVAVNMAAIPESLADTELFGHVKGAFTGANRERKGLIMAADGGTVFLDEVNAMSPHLQSKLLRVIQERCLRPVGSDQEIAINVRFISATNENLDDLVNRGGFRRDLYHRLRVLATSLPPLRERRDDIPILAQEFLERFARRYGKRARRFTSEALDVLRHRDYPGNIRQLENLIEEMVILSEDSAYEVGAADSHGQDVGPVDSLALAWEHPRTLAAAELAHIARIMEMTEGNKARAAKILDIDYKTLLRKLSHLEVARGQT